MKESDRSTTELDARAGAAEPGDLLETIDPRLAPRERAAELERRARILDGAFLRRAEAISALEEAVELDPSRASADLLARSLARSLGRSADVARFLERALARSIEGAPAREAQ